jgi:hypothetical protein
MPALALALHDAAQLRRHVRGRPSVKRRDETNVAKRDRVGGLVADWLYFVLIKTGFDFSLRCR